MDLAELKFIVDTKELETAATRVAELGTAVSKLNKPMQDLSKESAKTNKEIAKSEEAAAKAALAQLKLQKAQEKTTESASKSTSVLERQNLILEYMAQGNSKGQASILATAKAAGALDADMLALNQTLKTQRTLIGGDPFDKSIGLMQKLQNEYKTTTEVSALFSRGLGLTEKQMVDLAREKERLIALYKIEGKSTSGLTAEYDQLIQKSVQINTANSARTQSMHDQIKAQNDAAKANNYINSEMDRLNRLTESNGTITSATNNKQIKFEQALKASGKTAKEQADLLKLFNEQMMATQKAAGNRQVDYLSRALGPQITDIGVGLATGQSPMMVLLQQGGQLRDQFALAGIAAKDMGDMLTKATIGMASSVKDVAVAVGSALGGAFVATGKGVNKFIGDITGVSAILENMRYQIALMEGSSTGTLMTLFKGLATAISILTGVIVIGAIGAFVALGVAMSGVIEEENALNRALNLTGAALGLNLNMAYDAARGMKEFGISTGTALEVLTEMGKAGSLSGNNLKMVATTAQAMKTAFGISIADTVKQFKELEEKPTDVLTKLAKQLGTIPLEVLKQVDAYERAGNSVKAAEIAMKAYAAAGKDAADRTAENFGVLTRLGISLGKIWSSTWESILNIGRKDTITDQLANAEKQLTALQGMRGADIAGSNTNKRVLATMKLVDDLKNQIQAEKEIEDQRKVSADAAAKFEDDKKKRDEAANKLKADLAAKLKYEQDVVKQATEAYIAQTGVLDHLTKSEATLLKIRSTKEFNALPPSMQAYVTGIWQATIATEKLNIETEKQRKISEEVVKTRNELVEAGTKQVDAAKLSTQALVDESTLYDYKLSLVGKEEKEAEKLLALKKIQMEYEKEIARIKALNLLSGTKEDLELEEYKKFVLKRENLDKEANLKAAQDFQKQFDNIKTGISDSIVTALFEGGQAGSKKLRDVIIAELKKPVVLVVKALVDAVLGSSSGGSTGSSLVGNLISKGANSLLGDVVIGGSTLAATGQAFMIGLQAGMTGTSTAAAQAAYTAAGQTGVSSGLAAGQMAAPVVGAVGGMAINRGISNGYSTGSGMQTVQDIATIAATAIFGPMGGLVTGAISGVFNRAFGMKAKEITGEGIVGTLSAQGADVKAFEDWFQKGGWFRSNKSGRNYSQVSQSLQEYLDLSLSGLTVVTKKYADALGIDATGLSDVTKSIELNLKGLSAEDRKKKIDEALGGFGDELAKKLGLESFDALQKLGEEVLKQRYDLETQLLELQGNTVALRERERAQIYETNQALFDQVKALEDKKVADAAAAEAMQKLTDVTTNIVDEINRLRGVNTSSTGLEAQFAILTAQARSGDLAALAQLPDVTKGLEQIAASSAVNATDIIIARARLAQSLQDTLGYVGANGLLSSTSSAASLSSVSSVSATGATTTVSATSSNQELLAALVTEVQGLRAEVRADVSHNAKTAKILERVNQDGESLTITTLV